MLLSLSPYLTVFTRVPAEMGVLTQFCVYMSIQAQIDAKENGIRCLRSELTIAVAHIMISMSTESKKKQQQKTAGKHSTFEVNGR